MEPFVKKILYSQSQIEARIVELAGWINKNYKDDELLIICILKGGMPFTAQLIKSVKIKHEIDFMMTSTYHGKIKSSKQFKLVLDLDNIINNKKILIVDDVIDSGYAIKNLKKILWVRKPLDIKVMSLLFKPNVKNQVCAPDIYGFKVCNDFLIGFGMDYAEKFRNLPYVAIFNKKYK